MRGWVCFVGKMHAKKRDLKTQVFTKHAKNAGAVIHTNMLV